MMTIKSICNPHCEPQTAPVQPTVETFHDLSTKQLAFIIEAIEGKAPGKLATLDAARKRVIRNLGAMPKSLNMTTSRLFSILQDWKEADVDHSSAATLGEALRAPRKPSIATVGGLPVAQRDPKPQTADEAFQSSLAKRVTVDDAMRGDLGLNSKPAAMPESHAKRLERERQARNAAKRAAKPATTSPKAPKQAGKRDALAEITALGVARKLLVIASNSPRIVNENAKAAKMLALIEQGDVAGVRAMRIPGQTGWAKMLNVYRDALLTTITGSGRYLDKPTI